MLLYHGISNIDIPQKVLAIYVRRWYNSVKFPKMTELTEAKRHKREGMPRLKAAREKALAGTPPPDLGVHLCRDTLHPSQRVGDIRPQARWNHGLPLVLDLFGDGLFLSETEDNLKYIDSERTST